MSRWPTDPADRADAFLAGALTAAALFSLYPFSDQDLGGHSVTFAVLAIVTLCVPIAFRRRAPRLVLGVVALGVGAIWLADFNDTMTAIAGSVALYSVGRHVERPASLWAFAVAAVPLGLLAGWQALTQDEAGGWVDFLGRCGVIAGAFWFGDGQRTRVTLVEVLREGARRADAERRDAERRAVLEERGRITRELHDVVAHSLSVMVIQAIAASRLITRDQEKATVSMTHVADVGRSALSEMRHVLGALDDDAAPDYTPLPTLADLEPLVERCRAAGLAVTVDREDPPSRLPAGVELSVVRIVQEALTNVMKHAPGARAAVRLRITKAVAAGTDSGSGTGSGDLTVTVEVVNTGGRAADPAVSPASTHGDGRGRGLIGLRERVEALGGTFRAGPLSDGGFGVLAVVPVSGRS